MIDVGDILRYHYRDEGLSRNGRSIRVFPHKAQVLVQDAYFQEVLHVGDVELYLGVEAGGPGRAFVGVVFAKRAVQFPEDGLDVAVVGLYHRGVQLPAVRHKVEVDLRESALVYFNGKGLVAK